MVLGKRNRRVGACIRALAAWLLSRIGYRRLHQATQLSFNSTSFPVSCQIGPSANMAWVEKKLNYHIH